MKGDKVTKVKPPLKSGKSRTKANEVKKFQSGEDCPLALELVFKTTIF